MHKSLCTNMPPRPPSTGLSAHSCWNTMPMFSRTTCINVYYYFYSDITLCPTFPFLFPSVLLPETEVCNHSFFIFLLDLYPTVPSFHARLDTFLLYSSPT